MISVTPLHAFNDNFIWVIHNSHSTSIAVVDPGQAEPVIQFSQQNNLTVDEILITHHHRDHTGGIGALVEKYGCKVYGPKEESITAVSHLVNDGDEIKLSNGLSFNVLGFPGHTRGHIGFYGHDTLFCGDTLFSSGCGRIFEGTYQQMYESLEKIRSLPDETLVYCAHEYTHDNLLFAITAEPDNQAIKARLQQVEVLCEHKEDTVPTSIALEKKVNPFLRYNHPTLKQNAEQYAGRVLKSEVEVFATVRDWKDELD